ncbi:MAG TPA: helix-turn-helix domain-containing protein [Conexivisphaerales archaeon]|nr:helix-turn-helix domain-containing protein [Conexivisphaerales archaeon]
MEGEVVYEKEGQTFSSKVKIFSDAKVISSLSSPVSLRILNLSTERQLYARELARHLNLSEQTVYYHVRRLVDAGLLEVVETSPVRGAVAKKLSASSDGLAVLYRSSHTRARGSARISPLGSFFHDFTSDHAFEGILVIGSPEPHGPFRAAARDGHYSAQLAFALGGLAAMPSGFFVRLDTDVKAEKAYDTNMVLFGGPATNLLTAEVNKLLPVRFDESNYWAGLTDDSGRRFNGETDAVVAKLPSPFKEGRHVVVLAGIRHVGTKSAVLGLTQQPEEVLGGYSGQEVFARVLRGYDQDGDGRIDRVDVLARYG